MKRLIVMGLMALAILAAGIATLARNTEAIEPTRPQHALTARGPEVVLQLPWGDGPDSIGRTDPDQASPEGPMSFALGTDGELWILDQVNRRAARFGPDGTLVAASPLPCGTVQDMEVAADGNLVLLDRLVRQSVMVVAPSGQMIREEGLVGDGIADGGGVSAMFAAEDGVWIEFEHTHMVRVLDETHRPVKRHLLSGRPADPSRRVVASIDGQGGAYLKLEDLSGVSQARTQLRLDRRIERIVWVEAQPGRNVLAVFHLMESGPASSIAFEGVQGVLFDELLQERGTFVSPYTIRRWEQFREFRVGRDGAVWQMALTDGGVVVLRWRWAP